MCIENPTLAHFRHFSSFFTKLPSTLVENPLQIDLFMQNKPKVKNAQISVSSFITSTYVKVDTWWNQKNKPNSKPIYAGSGSQQACEKTPKSEILPLSIRLFGKYNVPFCRNNFE
jgi:hypothetical protein